ALGTLVSCRIASAGIDRFIHGYVSSVNQCEEHRWQLSVVPQLAVTRQRRNLRVFQNINVVDLVVSILAEYGLSAQTTHLIGEYPEQPFWLQ
ncbi:contractile injection system protein, VgrG/Pvc8 family, partial [Metapseudomonas otitidis]|uniref:contractile injection system protein, VgrG/Pvc8 family n=2 Tax=Pseudomonadaceae TaxID=135621 RepID=UPI003672AABF